MSIQGPGDISGFLTELFYPYQQINRNGHPGIYLHSAGDDEVILMRVDKTMYKYGKIMLLSKGEYFIPRRD
jgi:hypothetical protein